MEDKYTEFLTAHCKCDFQQSKEWAKVKSNWKNEIVIIYDTEGNIVGTASILIRKLPVFGNIMYVPRGPVCNIYDMQVMRKITDKIKDLQKKYKAFIVIIEPYVLESDSKFKDIVINLGYRINSNAKSFDEEIQARHIYRLDIKDKTKDEVFAGFSSKTRYNIRLAARKGVEIKKAGEDLNEFYKLMLETCDRNAIIPRPKEYFYRLRENLGEHVDIYLSYYEGKAISSIMTVTYGKKMWYLYGASSNEYRNIMANYLLQWKMIEKAIEQKLYVYDFRGSTGYLDNSNGLYRFKKGFGTEIVELIGEITIEPNPLKCKFFRFAEKNFRKLRRKIYLYRHKNDLLLK